MIKTDYDRDLAILMSDWWLVTLSVVLIIATILWLSLVIDGDDWWFVMMIIDCDDWWLLVMIHGGVYHDYLSLFIV